MERVFSVQYGEDQDLGDMLDGEAAQVIDQNADARTAALKMTAWDQDEAKQVTTRLRQKGFQVLADRPFNQILPVQERKPVWHVPVNQ